MNEDSVKQLAEILAIYAELKGMEVFNAERESEGKAFAYDEEAFLLIADKLHKIAKGAK